MSAVNAQHNKGYNNGGSGGGGGERVVRVERGALAGACCILHVAHFTVSSSYDKRYGKRQQCRTHVPRHCMLSFCLCLCFVTHAPLPYFPSSTPTVCDPLNFVCCLWRKKMRLSILATCKNFISCAGDVAVQCIDPHSLTHTHTYISHMLYHS